MTPFSRIAQWLDELRESYRAWRDARRRRREAGVGPGDRVRDGCTGEFLRVVRIGEKQAGERLVNGTPLAEYGVNAELDCAGEWVVECRYPGVDRTYELPASRLRSLRIEPDAIVRDRFGGETLKVRAIRETLAGDVTIEGVPLSEYGRNRNLDCANDWVADCTYYGSNQPHPFPLSRLVPEQYPTRPESWKERVTNTKACYSCDGGTKARTTNAACRSCTERIKRRDGYSCQQKGCSSTDSLQVHHLYYEPDLTGTVPDRNLITLCRSCHKDRHGIPD